jgi:hypothetical protein
MPLSSASRHHFRFAIRFRASTSLREVAIYGNFSLCFRVKSTQTTSRRALTIEWVENGLHPGKKFNAFTDNTQRLQAEVNTGGDWVFWGRDAFDTGSAENYIWGDTAYNTGIVLIVTVSNGPATTAVVRSGSYQIENLNSAASLENPTPEDHTNLMPTETSSSPASDFSSDIVNQAGFIRFLAPPTPVADTTGGNGATQFHNVGCGSCHIPRQRDANSPFGGMSRLIICPYTNAALHTMGTGLQDGISQGVANGQQFRTAPLVGNRSAAVLPA